jgi:hypothetical protein
MLTFSTRYSRECIRAAPIFEFGILRIRNANPEFLSVSIPKFEIRNPNSRLGGGWFFSLANPKFDIRNPKFYWCPLVDSNY